MKFLSSLDAKDRRLLLWSVGIAVGLAVLAGVFLPSGNSNSNPMPSTYLSGRHGARAAYELLLRAGYPVERWERPLGELAATAGPGTVVIFAQPFSRERSDTDAVREIVERGGRVLATGFWGGIILPGGASTASEELTFAACKLDAEGLDPLAGSGEVWMVPEAGWMLGNPMFRVQYGCAGQPAVVEYDWKKGHVVWWASSTPLENGSIARGHNLDLFLNSLGTREGHKFYWDESLHGEVQSPWKFAGGAALNSLYIGLAGIAVLVVFSFSRRSGPVRELPSPPRATPIEFLEALGSLYRNAGAASAAVAVAWERFRRFSLRICGLRIQKLGAAELAAVIRQRFAGMDPALEADLAACEEAAWGESVEPRQALKLVQMLHRYQEELAELAKSGGQRRQTIPANLSERAS
jgi:Domain of unknown function (DUF4350)